MHTLNAGTIPCPQRRRGDKRCVSAGGSLRLLALAGTRAGDAKPTDDGKAAEFKGKTFDLAEKGKAAITLTFLGGEEDTVTVKSDEKTDVNLYVLGSNGTAIAKDESPGPDCELKFTPKSAVTLTLEVRNLGPGATKSTLKASFGNEK